MKYYKIVLLFLFIAQNCFAQWENRSIIKNDNITYPETSKMATVSNTIGITEIKIKYHRPAVKNRTIFGELIPYNKVWRAGANESTTISFQDRVTIDNQKLGPGTYGIHIIPNPKEWIIILSNNHTQWGSFYYDKSEDALRISVQPESIPHQELLKYDFENINANNLEVSMRWAKTKISFNVEVDEVATALAVIRDELRTLPRFRWHGNREAALYCWVNDVNFEEALEWLDRSIRLDKNFKNIYLKALLLKSMGKEKDATTFMNEALEMGKAKDFMYMAMEVLGHHNNPDKAIQLFEIGIKNFPESSQIRAQLANAYGLVGENEKAKSMLRIATSLAKSDKESKLIASIKRRYNL